MGAFITALPAFIAALPSLIQLALKLMTLTEKIVHWAEKNDLAKWIESLESSIDQLEKADTPDAKLKAAKSLSAAIRKL